MNNTTAHTIDVMEPVDTEAKHILNSESNLFHRTLLLLICVPARTPLQK